MKPPLRVCGMRRRLLQPCESLLRRDALRVFCSDTITSTSECPHASSSSSPGIASSSIRPYDEVPGPRPIPILGNAWRLLPLIGQYQISDVGKISQMFYDEYGKIVRLSGLMGRPDLLFVYDADEIEKVYRLEGPTPFRPSMPCLVHYKSVVRKDFFGDLPGVVGV
ncbi:Uncharacterized protein DBV15_00404 [Temnothorax longispinosus]|uniref:Cytochrome P450 301a1, mitochondrial n=4 Tax=Temnothorax TaxID=300110 RepID=A0A4S2JQ43_9HYME|nr:Uncharacterized protein DBV15_00404 [Temnothorax longispinosus]